MKAFTNLTSSGRGR